MNIVPLLLCVYCLMEENEVTAKEKECSSRSETEAGGYFELEEGNGHFGCVKRINVNKGFRVRMFLMSSKNNFEVEVVEFNDGMKPPVQAFVRNLEMYVSKGNDIEVWIDAKSAPLDIQWWRVCGGTLYGNSGKLIGPDNASGYPENQICTWNITVQNGYMLLLTINVDGYNDRTNCSLDHIQVMEVQSETTISRWLICSGILTLKSNKATKIVFHSDNNSATGLSFNASWVSNCGETFNGDSGELASPDNPVDFDSEVRCNWTISVSPGHTIVINYTLPKTSNNESGCKSYVQVTEADSDALKILCKSNKFAVHKSSSNTLRISFMYEPGMNYSRFCAKWHSEDAQKHEGKGFLLVSNTEISQAEGSNGSTTAALVTLQQKDRKVKKTSLLVADAMSQIVATLVALVIFIILLILLVRFAKLMRCFSRGQTSYDIKENMYDSLNEIDIKTENSNLEISSNIHLPRRRLPTPLAGKLHAILARVRKRIQFGIEIYNTAHGELELRESKHEDIHSEQEQETFSIRNESTMESYKNAGYISADNIDQVKRRSVCSIKSVDNDCVVNESTVETIDNDGYLRPVDFNSSLAEKSPSIADSNSITLKVDIHQEEEKELNTPLNKTLDSVDYTVMGEFIETPSMCITLDDGAQRQLLYGDKDETHGKQAAIKEIITDQSKNSYLTLPAYPRS